MPTTCFGGFCVRKCVAWTRRNADGEKGLEVALVTWPARSRMPKLERLKHGKRQAWTPVISYWCRVEGQERAIEVVLVPWPAGSGVPKEPLEGFVRFEAWQTASLKASKKLLMPPWRPRKSFWCGLGALACGVRGAKRAFAGFWRVWSLANGRLERQEQVIDVALTAKNKLLMWPWVPWPAGSRVPKELLEGFVRFEAWQTAGLTRVKSYWCRLEGQEKAIDVVPWRAGSGMPKEPLEGFMEGLKPGKLQAWTPVKSYWCRLEGQERAIDVALVPWRAGSGVPKEPLEGFGGFEAWQTAGLNARNKWCRLDGQEQAFDVALGALACGVTRAKRAFGGLCTVWSLKPTAGLNASKKGINVALKAKKKLLMWPWCLGLRGHGCQRRVLEALKIGKRQAWTPVKWRAIDVALKAKKKLLMWPWCLGLRGQGCQKSLWTVLEGLKPGKLQAWTPVKSYWCCLEGQENKRHAWAPCDERAKFHTFGGPRRRPGLSEGRGRRIHIHTIPILFSRVFQSPGRKGTRQTSKKNKSQDLGLPSGKRLQKTMDNHHVCWVKMHIVIRIWRFP